MCDCQCHEFFQSMDSLVKSQLEVYTLGKAQFHDIGIVLLVFEGGYTFRELVQIHVEEFYREFTVDIVQLIFLIF